ncbi:MAG: acyl-ACP--UDP-N-acetylglucosamine O-acyltransferase [Deltaproteobacteria bacterium]|nr:acyl-ACP--UDP-N-acetylglucosamine O-acyltransferase [Deltaproteobacteria bacterium]
MSTAVHPTAIVAGGATLGEGVSVGPYAIIGEHVVLGEGCEVGAHAVVDGHTTLGPGCKIFPHAAVGFVPQDLKYAGEPTRLEVGARNVIREFATLHIGTEGGGGVTRLGDGNLVMAYAHIAHDCILGDGNILANGATLAGHVTLEDHIILGGLSAVHQFVRVGKNAFVSGGSMVAMDVPPYCTVQGDRASLVGLNTVGLKRHGYSEASIKGIKAAYKELFRSGAGLREAIAQARAEFGDDPEVAHLIDFVEQSERGIAR